MSLFNELLQSSVDRELMFRNRLLPIEKRAIDYYQTIHTNDHYKDNDIRFIAQLVGTITLPSGMHNLFSKTTCSPFENKFQHLYHVLHNPFIEKRVCTEIMLKFSYAQRLYRRLNRFVYLYKWKKASIANSTDLLLNPITSTQTNLVYIMQHNQKYVMTVLDITSIIDSALTNSPNIYAEPMVSRNPYNNIPFSKATLYNIYFQIKHGDFILSPFFHQYFLSNFHLKMFRDKNEALIRSEHIRQFIDSNDHNQLHEEILNMIEYYNHTVSKTLRLDIHHDFPKDILLRIFKPYVKLYYTLVYSLDLSEKHETTHEFKYRMKKFVQYNPAFGRMCRKTDSPLFSKKKIRTITFNMDHIPWSRPTYSKNYDTCHLEIIEDEYDEEKMNGPLLTRTYLHRDDDTESLNDTESFNETEDAAELCSNNDETVYTESDSENEDVIEGDSEDKTICTESDSEDDDAIESDSDTVNIGEIIARRTNRRTNNPMSMNFDDIFGPDTESDNEDTSEATDLANIRSLVDQLLVRVNDINLNDD